MLRNGKFLVLTTLVILTSVLALLSQQEQVQVQVQEQEQVNDRRADSRNTAVRPKEPSDLAKENLSRVAASSAQIQSVLSRDPGILVELKTWVAKEATDNGQVVDDSLLTDLAIFDRLDRDVEFRSVATRMVQRYGYLMPAINPDSEIAKQRDLVLKERAHIMAQRQDQEQAAQLAAAEKERDRRQETPNTRFERTACDPRSQTDCTEPATSTRGRSTGLGTGSSSQDDMTLPDMTLPVMPDQMSPGAAQRTLRRSSADQSDSGGFSGADGLTLASDRGRSATGSSGTGVGSAMGTGSAAGMGLGMSGGMPGGGMDGMDSLLRRGNPDDLSAAGNRMDATTASIKDVDRTVRLPGSRGRWDAMDRDLPPVAMVHKVNPYADIPSLYDMYVQAAS